MAGQHQLIGLKASDDVLVGFGPVDPHDIYFAVICRQAGLVVQGPRRVGDALDISLMDVVIAIIDQP